MRLYLNVEVKLKDFNIDYIEIELENGDTATLGWEESEYIYHENGCEICFKNLYFNEDPETLLTRINTVRNCAITNIGFYTEDSFDLEEPLVITGMTFEQLDVFGLEAKDYNYLPYKTTLGECDYTG